MGYSKETPNYKLALYVADDKPSYLGDWNETMGKIDGGLQENKTEIIDVDTKVANMKRYVDDEVSDLTTYVNTEVTNTKDYVDNSMALVDSHISRIDGQITTINKELSALSSPSMVVFGDSWTDLHTTKSMWPTLYQNMTGNIVKTYGVGATGFKVGSKTFINQINDFKNDTTIDKTKVKHAIIMGGINDWLNGQITDAGTLAVSLKPCVDALKAINHNIEVIYLPNHQYPFLQPLSNAIYSLETAGCGTPAIECRIVSMMEWFAPSDYLDGDLIHVGLYANQKVIPNNIYKLLNGGTISSRCVWTFHSINGTTGGSVDYTISLSNWMYIHSFLGGMKSAAWWVTQNASYFPPCIINENRHAIALPDGTYSYADFASKVPTEVNKQFVFTVPASAAGGFARYAWSQPAVSYQSATQVTP